MFKVIKKTKCKTNDISSIISDNVSFSDPKLIAEKFNEFFTGVAQKIADEIPPASMPENFFNTPPNHPIFDFGSTPVTNSEIVDVIKELKVKKTLDCNWLSTLILSKHALTLSTPLKHVISLSLNTGIVPAQLKIAKVIPIFKSGDKQQLDNYRPISLLNVFSKIYERVVYNRLVTFLNINELLSPYQFGFRKGHSTVHPLTLFMNTVSESLNKKKTFNCYLL
jgi:Reverse transcriptase (RNA-dependent DNA polymerase)